MTRQSFGAPQAKRLAATSFSFPQSLVESGARMWASRTYPVTATE